MTKTELLEQILAELKAIHALLEADKRGETFTMNDGNQEYEVRTDTLEKTVTKNRISELLAAINQDDDAERY